MILATELDEIAQRCKLYNVSFNSWSFSPTSETRYYVNLYSRGDASGGPRWCKTKLWFTRDDPKIQIDDRYVPLSSQWSHHLQWEQREINRFFEDNQEKLAERKRLHPD